MLLTNLKTCRESLRRSRMLDRKSYAIQRREMLNKHQRNRKMDFGNMDMMAGDKMDVTIIPGMQSSMLISLLWISSVIFVTVLFTYTYTAIHDMWWY